MQLALLSANHTEKVSDKDEKTYEPAHEAAHVLLGVFAFIPVLVGVVDCVVELFNKFGDPGFPFRSGSDPYQDQRLLRQGNRQALSWRPQPSSGRPYSNRRCR